MKNTIPFNINSHVRVRLTERGEEIYREFFPGLPSRSPRQKCDDGWNRFQLWHLMEIFGPRVSLAMGGCALPFATEILIESDAAQQAADAELDACCEWIRMAGDMPHFATELREVRRQKPPTPRRLALELLPRRPEDMASPLVLSPGKVATIRRALELLPDDQ